MLDPAIQILLWHLTAVLIALGFANFFSLAAVRRMPCEEAAYS